MERRARTAARQDLLARLHACPNLVLWIAGHRHRNVVTALPSPDPSRPELGFWEVETSSLRDFPQQLRTFEIVLNGDDTLSILATDVDTAIEEGEPAWTSRTYAVAAQQIFDNGIGLLPTGAYNAELVVPLAPEMRAKLAGRRPARRVIRMRTPSAVPPVVWVCVPKRSFLSSHAAGRCMSRRHDADRTETAMDRRTGESQASPSSSCSSW